MNKNLCDISSEDKAKKYINVRLREKKINVFHIMSILSVSLDLMSPPCHSDVYLYVCHCVH